MGDRVGVGINVDNSMHTYYSNRTNQFFNNNMQCAYYTCQVNIFVILSANINLGFRNKRNLRIHTPVYSYCKL